jgi:hypothetical protein
MYQRFLMTTKSKLIIPQIIDIWTQKDSLFCLIFRAGNGWEAGLMYRIAHPVD